MYKDDPIVIFGGSSSVGQFVIQAAKLSGFNPIVTTSSPKHAEFLKTLGATHVIDRSSPNVASLIKKFLPGGVTGVVYDAIATESTQRVAIEVTKPDARILLTGAKVEELNFGDRLALRTFGNVHAQRKIGIELYSVLFNYLQDGSIKVGFLDCSAANSY
jgi:NADPH:quinone reductase-like Zn-dependent oxidoreductase